jgi:hypothetical protein
MKEEGVFCMRFPFTTACALFACVLISSVVRAESVGVTTTATATAAATATLPRAELNKMVRDAKTTEQYLELASYFRWREQQFEQQAQSERAEMSRRSMNAYLAAAKYPNPVASSRNRYEYFSYEAGKMSRQAAHFEGLSASVNH